MFPRIFLPLRAPLVPLLTTLLLSQASAQPAAPTGGESEAPPRSDEEIVEATAAERQPLENYEASEQISEDLSVSFPVDI